MIGRLLTKLKKSYYRRGALGTVRYAFQRVTQPLLDLTPTKRREWRRRAESDREFDSRYGVDTGGFIQLNRFRIASANWEYGTPYGAIHPEDFARAVGALDIYHPDYTFVDFGSGKGRAILLASDLPFKKIVGVEFSPELVEIARQNVRVFHRDSQQCRDIEPLCADALEYQLPEGPSVFYFYNPFDREVMERMVAKVARSYRERAREIYILYVNPMLGELWEQAGCFKTVVANGDYAIYKTKG
jgi:hypothetical protein